MKKFLLLAGITMTIPGALTIPGASAQCPITATLYSKGSQCFDADTLTVATIKTPSKITWYNGNIANATVTAAINLSDSLTIVSGSMPGSPIPNFELFGMAIGPGGSTYVLDILNNRVLRFPNPVGASTGVTVAGGNGKGTATNQFNIPFGIYADVHGNLFVCDSYNYRVLKFPPGSTDTTAGITVAGGNGFGSAANQFFSIALTVDALGYLYVVDTYNGRIQKFPPGSTDATNGVTIAGGNGMGSNANQLVNPSGIYLDDGGNIFVADRGNNRIQKFPPGSTGATNGVTVAGGNGPGPGANQLNNPYDVFVDNKGKLYVSDVNNDRIQEFPPGSSGVSAGVTVALWNGGGGANNNESNGIGTTANQFAGAANLYVDTSGDIFLAENYENRVEEWKKQVSIDTTYVTALPGVYTAVVTGSDGCSMTTNPIIVQPIIKPVLNISASATTICAGTPAQFHAYSTNGNTPPVCQWQVNGNPTGPDNTMFTDDSLANGDAIRCVLAGTQSCPAPVISNNTLTMTVNPSPSVVAGDDTILAPGKSLRLAPSTTGAISSYQWTPASGLDNPSLPNPVAFPLTTTTYQLEVVADDGCTASGKLTVLVYYTLQMPNAFTPNGDGKNDVFRIPPSTPQKIKRFCVFDRTGNRLFMTTDSGNGWDGTYNNRLQPVGVYVWEIEYEDLLSGKNLMARGTVVLVR